MPSRKIEDLIPTLQEKYKLFALKMEEAGINFMVTDTMRTQNEQEELYAKGRTKPGNIVTWTLKSNHIPREGEKGGRAFDIAIVKDGKPTWDTSQKDVLQAYYDAGTIGESIGLKWGGHYKTPDMPHFEYLGEVTPPVIGREEVEEIELQQSYTATIALSLLERSFALAIPDGYDNSGRQQWRLSTPGEAVARCYALAEEFRAVGEIRGHIRMTEKTS